MLLPHLLFSFLLLTLCRADGAVDSAALGSLVARADNLLAAGQFADAARTYSEAIEQSPTSYLNYYKRATAYLSLNRHSPALEDFDTVLKLNGDFHKALFMKGKIYAKEGRWSEGRDMLKLYSKKVKGDRTVADLLFELSEAEVAAKKAVAAEKAKQYPTCIEQATVALQTAAYSATLRQLRVNCALASGDVQQAIGDLTRLTHLVPPSTPLLLAISTLSYYLLPASTQATASLKQCLHFDPDSKPCRTALRELKAFDKSFTQLDGKLEGSDWRGIINLVVGNPAGSGLASKFEAGMTASLDALKTNGAEAFVTVPTSLKPKKSSPQRLRLYKAACKAYVNTGEIRKSESWCSEVLKMDGGADDQDALVGMGEVALKKEEWEEAVRLFEKAFEASGRSSQDIHTRLDKARRLLKQSKAKDYYKVLGVARDADLPTIKKAYRKLAKNAHPDRGGSESKMAAVNEAYEVLSDAELRRRFDAGDDPNDPTSGQGGHPFPGGAQYFFQQGSPFGQFQGMPFGGQGGPFGGQGGFQFHWGG